MYGESARKPSGSSTHSGTHSPTASPNSVQPPRKITPTGTTTTGNMLSVGVPGPNGKMGLGNTTGWLAWDSGSPSSRRNPSISSATSGNELSSSQIDSNYWSKSRPTSGNWDDALSSPQPADLIQLDSALSLHPPRQRQSQVPFSGPRGDDRSAVSKKGHLSPQRFDNAMGKDSSTSRYTSGTSPTRSFGTNTYNAHSTGTTPSGGYDPLPKPHSVEDLSVALRGMAVEDDFTVHASRQQTPSAQTINPNSQVMRGPPSVPQQPQRGPYPSFPQPDYGGYYASPPGRDTYLDYPYGFDAYHGPTDPTLFSPALANANSAAGVYTPPNYGVADINRPGMYYDYGAAARLPASQYFYPGAPPPMMYPAPHSPIIATTPATLSEKKRDLSYAVQQSLASQSMMYGSERHGRSRSFGGGMEFSASQPLSSPMYGPNGVPFYPTIVRPGRRDGGHPALSLRSPMLDEFRSNKARKWELRDIFGYVVEFSGDQHGSRFIQQKLEVASAEETQAVFDEIVPAYTLQLIQDVFGNYVIQKLFEFGSMAHRAILCNSMEGHILPLSMQMYGCRVVQKAIEYIGPDKQATFVKEVEAHVLKCVKDSNGNHVIQKMVERIPSEMLGFVDAFQGHVKELSTHPYGCRVLQRCLEHLPDSRTRALMDELLQHALALMQDQFGNYVVQFVIEHGQAQDRLALLTRLRGHMLPMARHKFASNVCEKALLYADPESRHALIDELISSTPEGATVVVIMMKDQFANYVLQRALAVVEGQQKEALIGIIRPNLVNMRRVSGSYGKHLAAIEKLLGPSNDQASEHSKVPEVILTTHGQSAH